MQKLDEIDDLDMNTMGTGYRPDLDVEVWRITAKSVGPYPWDKMASDGILGAG